MLSTKPNNKQNLRRTRLTVRAACAILLAANVAHAQVSTLISSATAGGKGAGTSVPNTVQSISANGRHAVFVSIANDLITGDTNGYQDVYVYDSQSDSLSRVSVDANGNEGNADSGVGIFQLFTPGAAISWSGRFVAFPSNATNLVPTDTNAIADIFIHDRDVAGDAVFDQAGDISTTLVSVDSSGIQANFHSWNPSVSADGRFVCFGSWASNLVPGDTNSSADIFVRDVKTGTTSIISVSTSGTLADEDTNMALISADGRWVFFESAATNLVAGDTNNANDIFLRDRDVNADGVFDQPGDVATIRVSGPGILQANGAASIGGISRDGRYISFSSLATNIVANDTNGFVDAFVRDNWTTSVTRVSLDSSGNQPNNDVIAGPMSGDGRFVLMSGAATNMYPNDQVADIQAFLRDRDPDQNGILDETSNVSTTLASVLPNGSGTELGPARNRISISPCGNAILFSDYDGFTQQTYLRDLVLDSDGDGLLDSWETSGIDFDADGTIDLTLPNANPQHKDIYVHMDAMQGRLPTQATLNSIINTFANVPNSLVQNPDGLPGITLHLEIDETTIAQQAFSAANPWGPIPPAVPPNNTFQWYVQNFNGTAAERANPNWPNIQGARRLAYRYFLWANTIGTTSVSGQGEQPGNQAYASLGNWFPAGGTAGQQAGIFLHELGHNLGLGHGGSDTINYKPNYPRTVMSYSWTMPTTAYPGWVADFTRVELPFLDESNLNELAGIGGPVGPNVPAGPPAFALVSQSAAVNWNRDSDFLDTGVAADITRLWTTLPASPGQGLCGHNDWPNLWLPLCGDGNFSNGPTAAVPHTSELTYEVFEMLSGNAPQTWSQDFDLFTPGDTINLHAMWETWCDYEARDATVDNLIFRSPPNSLMLSFDPQSGTGSDVVARYSTSSSLGYNSGAWNLSMWTYVPSTTTGSAFIIGLNKYCNPSHNWSMQVQLDADAGLIADFDGSILPMTKDQWIELRVLIDLDADTFEILYDNQTLTVGVWSQHVSGSLGFPGVAKIAALNLYSETATEVFFDDMRLESAAPPPTCAADINNDGSTDVFDFALFAANFGAVGLPPFAEGDLDGDGDVDVFDFALFAADFGCTL